MRDLGGFFWGCKSLYIFLLQGKADFVNAYSEQEFWLIMIFLFPILAGISLTEKVLLISILGAGDSEKGR